MMPSAFPHCSHRDYYSYPGQQQQWWRGVLFFILSVHWLTHIRRICLCLCTFLGWFPEPMRTWARGLPPSYLVTRNRRRLLPGPEAGKPVEGAWKPVITSETWAALEIHNSVPSLHLSSPPGQAPLGSFIFVLMAALDNGAAEKSQKVKTQLWH